MRSRRRARSSAESGHGAPITSRMSCPPPIGVMARTVPRAVTMPVNISGWTSWAFGQDVEQAQQVGAERCRATAHESGHPVQPVDPEGRHRRPAVPAHRRRRMEPGDPVHQPTRSSAAASCPPPSTSSRVRPAAPRCASPCARSTPIAAAGFRSGSRRARQRRGGARGPRPRASGTRWGSPAHSQPPGR